MTRNERPMTNMARLPSSRALILMRSLKPPKDSEEVEDLVDSLSEPRLEVAEALPTCLRNFSVLLFEPPRAEMISKLQWELALWTPARESRKILPLNPSSTATAVKEAASRLEHGGRNAELAVALVHGHSSWTMASIWPAPVGLAADKVILWGVEIVVDHAQGLGRLKRNRRCLWKYLRVCFRTLRCSCESDRITFRRGGWNVNPIAR